MNELFCPTLCDIFYAYFQLMVALALGTSNVEGCKGMDI